jgi:hypothetical protein
MSLYKAMLVEAADLFPDVGEWENNPEYLRGMCELIARMFPIRNVPTDERASEVRHSIRIRIEANTLVAANDRVKAEVQA